MNTPNLETKKALEESLAGKYAGTLDVNDFESFLKSIEGNLEIVKAEYVGDYKLHLWFNNQEEKVVDLENSLQGPVFQLLKNKTIFSDFQIKFNTIEWKNGADFAPEYLYSLA